MKQIVMFILVCSSIAFSQGIYFSEPTSSHIDYIYASGEGPIVWNFYHANGIVVYRYYAKLTYPDGSQTEWTTSDNGAGEIGGWWVSKAGTYQIQGKAWVQSVFGGSAYWAYRDPFSFNVVDNYEPSVPQSFSASWSGDNPMLTWISNTELDIESYTIAKMVVGETDWTNVATVSASTTQWIDSTVSPAWKFDPIYTIKYKVKANDINNHSSSFSSEQSVTGSTNYLWKISAGSENETITDYRLFSNYPNPFNPSTKISFQIPKDSFVNLTVYNSLGQEIKELVKDNLSKGKYIVEFNAENLPSGLYIYKIQAGKFSSVKKMMLTK